MANRKLKTKGNAPGRYYVDQECIACDACTLAAGEHFKLAAIGDESFAFVSRQPNNKKEEEACLEAMEACPVEAIGSDGES